MYYLIQWKDKQGRYHNCSQKGQLEVFEDRYRAIEALEEWQSLFDEIAEYSIAVVQIVEREA